jgi:hypothetical protein
LNELTRIWYQLSGVARREALVADFDQTMRDWRLGFILTMTDDDTGEEFEIRGEEIVAIGRAY